MTGPLPPGSPQPAYPSGEGGFTPPQAPSPPIAPGPGYPATAQPGYAQPGYAQPGYAQPGYAQPGYAQPGYGPGPSPGPPPKSGSGKGCLIAFLVVLALVVVAAVVVAIFFGSLFGGILDFGQRVVENATTVGEPEGHIGDTVEVAGTQFVVRSFDCGQAGSQANGSSDLPVAPATTTATDEVCIAKVSVRNNSSSAMGFTGTEAQAFMGKDDTEPIQSMPSLSSASALGGLGDLDPGRTTEIDYMFGVPKGTRPMFLKLHAGMVDPTSGASGNTLPGPLGPGVTVDVTH